jgi:puromycin-sensitive aminopeptidase
MLDAITYQKGGSVLRMLEQYLGADVYRDGIRRYLATHAYANTVTSDLWDALESVSGRPVGEIMATWILQGGHPVVTVDDGGLSQAPFSFGPPSGASAIGERWEIPVLTRSIAGGDAVTQLLGDTSIGLGVSAPAVVNAGGSGVYRTSYDGSSLESISSSLGALTEIERAVLVSDTRALALAGRRSVADVLTLAAGLGVVVEPSPWATVVEFLCTLDRIAPDDVRPALRSKAHDLLSPVLAQTGWDPSEREDGRTGFVRASLILGLGRVAEDADVRAEAASRFDSGVVEGDTADAVIAVVAAMNRPGDRDEMLRRFQEAKDPQSAARYRLGVASIADRELAVATFRACFELFRSQDAPRVIAQLVRNPTGGRAVWEALAESWDATVARVTPLMQFTLGAGLPALIDDRRFAERVLAFHEANPVPTGQQRIKQSLERMMNGVAFAERARPTLADALA